jgi:hypothetical protein
MKRGAPTDSPKGQVSGNPGVRLVGSGFTAVVSSGRLDGVDRIRALPE